jgi:hypothetical protein
VGIAFSRVLAGFAAFAPPPGDGFPSL